MQLSKFQDRFKDTMLDHPDALKSLPGDFETIFQENGTPIPERLAVYRNNIVGSLTDVMIASHPALEKLVGKEFLESMGRSFVLENPPCTGCLNDYGAGFDDFIRGFAPAEDMPYLGDVALMEILMNKAYYAADDAALTPEALNNPPDGQDLADMPIDLRDHVHLLRSPYPLDIIYDFTKDESAGAPDLESGRCMLMIFRRDFESAYIRVEDSIYKALENIQNHKNFGEAIEETLEEFPNFDLPGFLQFCFTHETLLAWYMNRAS